MHQNAIITHIFSRYKKNAHDGTTTYAGEEEEIMMKYNMRLFASAHATSR